MLKARVKVWVRDKKNVFQGAVPLTAARFFCTKHTSRDCPDLPSYPEGEGKV